jgi:hypothetical protein
MTARAAQLTARRASWREQAIIALATPHALEFYGAAVAMLWGLATALDFGYLNAAHTAHLLDYVGGRGWVYGLVPALTGALGLLSLLFDWRQGRVWAAQTTAFFWWCATGWFVFGPERPVTSAIVIYGMAALAEAWVAVRVSQGFEDLVRDVRKRSAHDRANTRSG